LVIALLTPQQHLWKTQLKVFILLAVSLPIFNLYYLISHQYVHDLHEYWLFLRVDLMIIILAILAIFLHQKIQPIQQKAVQKIQKKYANTAVQEPNS
ncbi:MAG TPA: PepSY domain-containing protein, partial [Acinetobacter johnsonii]|nr:PepSY domain-containing protein [Acinetobacter johnsonii]